MTGLRRTADLTSPHRWLASSRSKVSEAISTSPATASDATDLTGLADLPLAVQGQRVLVVDDEEYVRVVVRSMLEDLGFEAVEACDGDQGLKAFDEADGEFAACVVDLTMPGMAGLELLELIRERSPSVPVLLVSGYSSHEVRQREAQSKNISFLQKPFTIAQFKSAIDPHLSAA
ncbi:MAG: two-component system cell cycle sensor histidine kinase/response regulator CckA [Candidatus Azotimanducaceae bacterium]|jgi:two-component system cell cycle sensor histidine kinase/response regulator CckA